MRRVYHAIYLDCIVYVSIVLSIDDTMLSIYMSYEWHVYGATCRFYPYYICRIYHAIHLYIVVPIICYICLHV